VVAVSLKYAIASEIPCLARRLNEVGDVTGIGVKRSDAGPSV